MGGRPRESWGREGGGRATERVKRERREKRRSGESMLIVGLRGLLCSFGQFGCADNNPCGV